MIEDFNNSREIQFGNGTVALFPSTIDDEPIAECIIAKTFSEVGTSTGGLFSDESNRTIKHKNVLLRFDGLNGIKSIDMLIEDLQQIRKYLARSVEK